MAFIAAGGKTDATAPATADAFRRSLSAALATEVDSGRIRAVATDGLGRYLRVARVDYSEIAIGQSLPSAVAAMLDCLAHGKTVATADVAQIDAAIIPGVRDSLLVDNVRASIGVPVIRGGALVAVLGVHHGSPRGWTAGEIALAEEVAERIWSTVARVRAEAALLEWKRARAFVTDWTAAVHHERSPRDLLKTTLARLGRHLNVDRLTYADPAGPSGALAVSRQWDACDGVVDDPLPDAVMGRCIAAAQLSGLPLVVPDVADHALFDPADLPGDPDSSVAALVSVPVLREGAVQAVLYAQSATPRHWTDAEVNLIGEVADRTSAILEHHRCEERLAQSEALLTAFMQYAPVGMHLKDAAGRYLRINPELALAMDLPADEVVGRHPDELFPPDVAERVAAMEAQALAGTPATGEFMAPPRERYASLLSIVFPIEGDGLVKTGGFTLDLTDRKSAEAALQRSRDALYQSEKLSALGSLLAGVSHELNNPLSIVVAQAVMMERQAEGSELAERAFKIRRAADRCARIVQTFLAMARQKKPERTAIDLSTIADAAIELADYGLRADGVGITRVLASDLPRISADGDQLHQIVTNLIVNAQQAMAQSRTLRWLEVRTALGEEPHTVILEVSDSGPGIPLDTRRRIFEPFFTTKPQGEGTGMGLSFSQGLAEAHGGRLTLVRSDSGACFRLTLPIDEHNLLPRVEPAPARPMPATPRRALIVDDEEEIAASLADFLSIEGFECEVVVGGAAAQRRLAEGGDYDLVVSDLRMPGIDGPALFAWIGDQRPDLVARTAFTTGDTLGTAAARFLAGAGRPVLEKPFMPDSIRHFLTAAVTG